MAVACNGIYESSFASKNEELKQALENIWRNGWLHAEKSYNDVHYVYCKPNSPFVGAYSTSYFMLLIDNLLLRYCHSLFLEVAPDDEINYGTPPQLAIDAIMQFQPHQLSRVH